MIESYILKSNHDAVVKSLDAFGARRVDENRKLKGWLAWVTRPKMRNGVELEQECKCCGIPTCNPCIREAALRGDEPPST